MRGPTITVTNSEERSDESIFETIIDTAIITVTDSEERSDESIWNL